MAVFAIGNVLFTPTWWYQFNVERQGPYIAGNLRNCDGVKRAERSLPEKWWMKCCRWVAVAEWEWMFFRFYDSICSRQLPNRTTTQDFPVNLCHRYSVFDCKRRMKVILFGFTLWLSSEETGWSVFKVSWWFPWLWIVTWFSIECLNTYPCFWAEEPPEISLCWIESYPCITSAVSLVFIHFYHTWTLVFPLKINLELICPIQNYFKQSFIPNRPRIFASIV